MAVAPRIQNERAHIDELVQRKVDDTVFSYCHAIGREEEWLRTPLAFFHPTALLLTAATTATATATATIDTTSARAGQGGSVHSGVCNSPLLALNPPLFALN